MSEAAGSAPSLRQVGKHTDHIERLDEVFYIRWTSGPNYERAFLCVEDGEPDMLDFAEVPFGQARIFAEAYRASLALSRARGETEGEGASDA